MDEQENEQEIIEASKDAINAVKDATNLAKNVSIGNAAGAAKNAINLANNKKIRQQQKKKIIFKVVIPIIAVSLLIILIVSTLLSIGREIKEIRDKISNFYEDHIVNVGAIKIDDDYLDSVIEMLERTGINLEDLDLMEEPVSDQNSEEYKERLRSYLRGFMQAEAMTNTIHIKPSNQAGWINERKSAWTYICI